MVESATQNIYTHTNADKISDSDETNGCQPVTEFLRVLSTPSLHVRFKYTKILEFHRKIIKQE